MHFQHVVLSSGCLCQLMQWHKHTKKQVTNVLKLSGKWILDSLAALCNAKVQLQNCTAMFIVCNVIFKELIIVISLIYLYLTAWSYRYRYFFIHSILKYSSYGRIAVGGRDRKHHKPLQLYTIRAPLTKACCGLFWTLYY